MVGSLVHQHAVDVWCATVYSAPAQFDQLCVTAHIEPETSIVGEETALHASGAMLAGSGMQPDVTKKAQMQTW